ATGSYVPPAIGRTRSGWPTPRSASEPARPCSASSSKRLRGCAGFGLIRSTGSSRSSGAGSAPASAGLDTLRIAARPRPIPRSATAGDLLGEFEVGVGPGAVRVVVDDGAPEARRLADAHVARDHGVEDELREVLAHLALDIAREPRAPVVHREQHPRDREARVELALHELE